MPDTNPFHANDPVEKVLQIFREAWFAGNQPDPDSFCADHPDSGIELRNRIENFLMAARMLPAMGASRDGSAPQILREPALKSGRFLGDFRILSEIGRGGMGVVYEAQQVSLNRKVALKVLPEHLSFSEQAIKKFQREAEAGGRQQHPGIVAVYAQGEHEGVHYIAHELIEGGRNLADQLAELRKKPRLPRDHFRYSASFIAEVAEALTHAHRSGVIHRDVKPSNILLDSEGQPKVTDFGLARIEDALSLSRSGDFAGTPFYMSPEQASGRNSGIDHRTDIYSLGVTLYEMLTLQRPFDGETSQDVLKKIIFHEPRNPCRINPRVPRDLAVICLKAMEKQPDHRYASMYDFADDLHRFLAGETILARPVGLFMQCAKCIRRNPVWSAALGVTALALLVGLVALIDSRNEAQRAEELSRKADAQRFLIEASDSFTANPGYGALLAYEGAKISGGLQANNMLLQALRACHEQREYTFSPGSRPVAVSPLGDRALVLTDEREAWIFGLPDEDRLCRLEELHGDLYSPEFSPDGCQIAVVEYDEEADALARHTVSLFDAKTGKKTQTLFGHTSLIHKAAFNRTSDKLITASWDMTARVWNLATGDCETTLKGHGWHATCAAFHSKGDRAITGSEDAVVRLWDLSTAKELTSFTGHEGEIRSVAFSPNDRMILSTSADRTFRIWDVESGKKLASIPDHAQALTGASFSREGNKVVTAAEDGSVMVWELAELFSYSRIESAIGNSSNGDDGEERVKEFHSFARISPVALRGHDRAVFRVLFDPRNSHVLTLSEDRTLRTWNAEAGLGCSEILEEAPCTGFSISGEGNKLAWVSMDRTRVRLWDLIEGRLLHDLDIQEGWLDNLDWTSYWAYENGSLNQERVGKAEWAARKPEILIDENDCRIRRVKLNARGTLLAVDFMGNIMQIRDLASGKEVKTFRYHGDIRSLCFSEDGKSILLAQGARCVQIFGLHDLSDHCFTDISEAFDLICARFDSTGKRILTVSLNGQACLWDRSLTQPLAVLCGEADSGQGKVLDVDWARFTPDEQQIVTRHMDGCLRLWDVRSGGKVFSEIPNAEGDEFRPVIDGSGSRILARTSTGEIAVHDLSGNRRRVLLRSRETFEEGSACFSPDSRFVAALTRNQAVRLYDASTGDLWISTNHESPILAMGFSKDSGNVISVFENGCVSTWPADPMKAAETYLPIKMPLDEWDAMRKARKRERGHENAVESDPSRSGIEKRVRDLAG
ncbi:MAG: protein kinase, partial [Planctomycetota bacterium]